MVDSKAYYFDGIADGPNGESDIPGHEWLKVGRNKWLGNHYNTGPFGAPQWWSSDAEDGALLWTVELFIEEWDKIKAHQNYTNGFVRYQALVSVEDGSLHPTKVAWAKHAAVRNFTVDGPLLPSPEFAFPVTVGISYHFMPNWSIPFAPETWSPTQVVMP